MARVTWGRLLSLAREVIAGLRALSDWMARRGIYECYDDGAAVCDPEASWCRYIGGGMRVGGALLFQSAPAGMCCVAYGSGDRLAVDSSGIMKMYERGEVVVAAELGSAPAWDTVYVMAGRFGEGAWPAYLGLAMDGSAYACEDLPPNAYCRLRGEPSIDEEPDLRRLFRGFPDFAPVEVERLPSWLEEASRVLRKARASCAEGERKARRLLVWLRAGP